VIVTCATASFGTVTVRAPHDALGEFAATVYVPGGVADLNRPDDDVVVLWW
jgi:hypothetical protein